MAYKKTGPCLWALNVNSVTTPKLEPPPLIPALYCLFVFFFFNLAFDHYFTCSKTMQLFNSILGEDLSVLTEDRSIAYEAHNVCNFSSEARSERMVYLVFSV
jgi:hypothetical protein